MTKKNNKKERKHQTPRETEGNKKNTWYRKLRKTRKKIEKKNREWKKYLRKKNKEKEKGEIKKEKKEK